MAAFTEGAHTYRMLIDGQMPVNAVPDYLRADYAAGLCKIVPSWHHQLLIATALHVLLPPPPG